MHLNEVNTLMKTRFTSLVKIKKNDMDKCERELQSKNGDVKRAQEALALALESLNQLELPTCGAVSDMMRQRVLIDSARGNVQRCKEWLHFATNQMNLAKGALKEAMMAFEKFKYLETQEIQARLKKEKLAEEKALDEMAGQAYFRNNSTPKLA